MIVEDLDQSDRHVRHFGPEVDCGRERKRERERGSRLWSSSVEVLIKPVFDRKREGLVMRGTPIIGGQSRGPNSGPLYPCIQLEYCQSVK